jgi:2,4-dienoyl-CoA reductase-like NADH-dependent reductase (Old Yellow Enzyme family)
MNSSSSQSALPRARNESAIDLFSPYRLGELELANRIVMAPMTRSRAVAGNVPNPLAVTYYAQRASAGLIVTEATQVSPQGVGYIRTPGIHSAEQVAGWKRVTAAVHQAGGKIFLQPLARRAHFAPRLPWRRAAGRTVGDFARHRGVHRERAAADRDAACARARRTARHRRAVPQGCAERQARRL